MRPWRFTLRTIEPRHFGSGWISGVLAAALGAIGFGAVVCFHYPSVFTVPELRALYPLAYMRALLHLVLVGAFVLGAISVTLRQNKALGVSGIGFALAAALLGGSQVPVDGELTQGPFLGLDWFLLSLMLYSATFVPLERLFALRPEQDVFRPAWRTDLIYFGMSALLLQLTTLLTMGPAMVFFDWAASARGAGLGVEPARRRPVPRDPRPHGHLPVLDPSRLPSRAAAVALPRDPPLGRDHGLDRRGATPPGRRGGDPRPDLRADLRARLRPGRARRLRDLRQRAGDLHPRQRALRVRAAGVAGGDATLPPLAPRHRAGGGGQELRDPPAGARLAVRDVPPAEGPLAVRLWRAVGSTGARRLHASARAPVPPPAVAAHPPNALRSRPTAAPGGASSR